MKIRMKTQDVAFQFRMDAGFAGDVNRTHPASIEPCLIDPTNPPNAYGQAVLVVAASQGVRPYATADASDATPSAAWGVTVRPFPFQQSSASNFGAASIGAATPPTTGVIDVLRAGYIMATVPAGQAPVKGGAVYVWCTASAGVHVQGGFEAVFSTTNTVKLSNAFFNGSPDAKGNVEISFNV
jgi:hypothetical protein